MDSFFGGKRRLALALAALLALCALTAGAGPVFGLACAEEKTEAVATARPSVNGRLRVTDGMLTDGGGNAVQLRGLSTHGLTWFPDFVNGDLFEQISQDWNCNLIRLAMYSENYCGEEREESLALMRRGIEAAVRADVYVLVDWHILNDADPNENIGGAAEFFALIAQEYADCPNLLFEICNEPNGETDWSDVYAYCETIIPIIRERIPGAVILAGTPDYDRNLGDSLLRPLPFDNVMYVLHFYAASHHEGLRRELQAAVDAGLPVFISECGISEASGDGTIDFASAAEWFSYLNAEKISYAVWSLSDKDESSACFRPGFDPGGGIRDEDLTPAGLWVRALIRGEDPAAIPAPAASLEKSFWDKAQAAINNSLGARGYRAVSSWTLFAGLAAAVVTAFVIVGLIYRRNRQGKRRTYDDAVPPAKGAKRDIGAAIASGVVLILLSCATLIYLFWRVVYSVPTDAGVLPTAANLLLLAVEVFGFAESLILIRNLIGLRRHPLPSIPRDAWPDVDVFIATYNEPADLLRRTINGCCHLQYPDRSKVHIWLCDDNRRPEMRALAQEMGVGYFDRPDNEGAKAGNLNHALSLTSAPYVVTLDADMIPRSDFLLKTIPYFVDLELREQNKPEKERLQLGFVQTPQAFYNPDVFQHALYSEKRVPNEQDFFYRTIEPAKTTTNSVIYGGSNTVLSRRALEDIGGFFTGSITEDFATGLLIEAKGYVSLALADPLASGQTPFTYREHVKQRTRWGRGVIMTAKKLGIWRRSTLTLAQKISYWSSVTYWYSPFKNLVYMVSPLLYAVFAMPVFRCNWLELLVFWLPMFILQDAGLRIYSKNAISTKWSGIYETCLMPALLLPILQETMGVSLTKFKVTDKTRSGGKRQRDGKAMLPFLILAILSLAGIVRILVAFDASQTVSALILLFWLIRNLYFLLMAIFLVDGRDSDGEPVKAAGFDPVSVASAEGTFEGVATLLTEHSVTVFLDDHPALKLGEHVEAALTAKSGAVTTVDGVVVGIKESKSGAVRVQTIEILDFRGAEMEYWQLIYDREPTLPQSLHHDFGVLPHLWQNIAHRVARTRK